MDCIMKGLSLIAFYAKEPCCCRCREHFRSTCAFGPLNKEMRPQLLDVRSLSKGWGRYVGRLALRGVTASGEKAQTLYGVHAGGSFSIACGEWRTGLGIARGGHKETYPATRIGLRLAYFSQPARMTSSGRSSSTSISVPSGMQLSSRGRV